MKYSIQTEKYTNHKVPLHEFKRHTRWPACRLRKGTLPALQKGSLCPLPFTTPPPKFRGFILPDFELYVNWIIKYDLLWLASFQHYINEIHAVVYLPFLLLLYRMFFITSGDNTLVYNILEENIRECSITYLIIWRWTHFLFT